MAPEYNVHGMYQRTISAGGSVEYTFYGTGIEFLSSYGTRAPTISVELNESPLGNQGVVRVNLQETLIFVSCRRAIKVF